MVNEYAERDYASSISNNHTRIFAGRLLSLLNEEWLDEFPATIRSIVRQLNPEITKKEHPEIFQLISEYFTNYPSKEFDPDEEYKTEQTIHFKPDCNPEIIIQTTNNRFQHR